MQELVYLNGCIGTFAKARVSVNDRGFIFGDGIYEVVRAYNGKIFALEEHLNRLGKSASEVELPLVPGKEKLTGLCRELLAQSGIKEAMIYIQFSRGTAPRNHFFDPEMTPNLLITVRHTPPVPPELYKDGISIVTRPDFRWQMCHIKSISLQANVLAKNYAAKCGAKEAVFTLPDGKVTECGSSNIFIFKDGVLRTHPEGNKILSGVTRGFMIQKIAPAADLKVREEAFTVEEMLSADEVFCTNSVEEVMPVVKVDSSPVGNGCPGEITGRLHRGYIALRNSPN